MKPSCYNIFHQYKNLYSGINLMSGIKIYLQATDYERYIQNGLTDDSSLYADLVTGGFLVEDDVDEYARLLHRRHYEVFYNNNSFQLTVLPTLLCNFKCWYCYEKHIDSIMSQDTMERVRQYVNHIIKTYPIFNLHLDWFGGEPLMYFNEVVKPISLYIKEICREHGLSFVNTITTNGYLIDADVIAGFNEIELSRFQITLDGYREVHNKVRFEKRGEDSYTRIIDNINNICCNVTDVSINIRINYTNKNIAGIGQIVNDIFPENRSKIYFTFQRVWQTRDIEDEASIERELEQQIEYIRQQGVQVNYNKTQYCSGVRCYADVVNQIVVNFDGTLFKCTARDFATHKASVGYLNEKGEPVWNENYYKYTRQPIFDNPKCRECKYVPVCLGTCSQKFVENGTDAIMAECNPEEWEESMQEELLQNLYDYITQRQNP